MKFFCDNSASKVTAIVAALHALIGFAGLMAACSNGVSESLGPLGTPGPKASGQDNDAAAGAQNQNKAGKPEDVLKDCSFEYSANSGKQKINWPGTKKSDCEAKCLSGRPQGILGICLYDNMPLSVDFKSETSGGLSNQSLNSGTNPLSGSPIIPRSRCALIETSQSGSFKTRTISAGTSQLCLEHCSSSTIDSQAKSAACYYDGAKISDVAVQNNNVTDSGAEVGTCKRVYTDSAGARVSETDQKSRAECGALCETLRQSAKSIECTFNGAPLLTFSAGNPTPGPNGQPLQNCAISHKDQATGESIFTSELKPKYEECEASCESKLKPSSVILKCAFGNASPFLDVNFGENFVESSNVSCTINSFTAGNSKLSTSNILGSECRKKCSDTWVAGVDSLKCSVP